MGVDRRIGHLMRAGREEQHGRDVHRRGQPHLSLLGYAEHVPADVHSNPRVAILLQHLSTQPGAAPHVQNHTRLVFRKAEHLERALRHLRLDVNHTGRVQVFGGLGLIVEHVGGRGILWTALRVRAHLATLPVRCSGCGRRRPRRRAGGPTKRTENSGKKIFFGVPKLYREIIGCGD